MAQKARAAGRKGLPYKDGELDVILSLAPTSDNIQRLSSLLERSEEAIEIVYPIAFEYGVFAKSAKAQQEKIMASKNRVGIRIGRTKPPE